MSAETHILSKMKRYPKGKAFVARDFMGEHSYESIKKALTRLVNRGEIRRVKRGVYDIAPYSEFLQEEVGPFIDEFAKAKARNFFWTIAPGEQCAVNLLGLSTQVPAKIIYLSTGPYRKYKIRSCTVVFRHKTLRELEGMSPISRLVVLALKGIGNGRVTDKHIAILKDRLSDKQKEKLRKETLCCPKWIYKVVLKVTESKKEAEETVK